MSLNPSVRILIVSGSSDIEDLSRRTPEFSEFLSKPFTADTLLATITEILICAKTTPQPIPSV